MIDNTMYYFIYRMYSTFYDEMDHKELVGWTDNEYIVKTFIQYADDAEYIVTTTDDIIDEYKEYTKCSTSGILNEEICRETIIDKLYSELHDSQLKIITSKTGVYGLTTDKYFKEIIEYSDIIYDLITELVTSIRKLLIISKYYYSSEMKSFLNYILIKYVSYLIDSYKNGDIMNSCIDVIYLLIQDGYIYEIR